MQLGNLISRMRGESKTVGLDIGHRLIKVAVVGHKQGAKGTLLALEHGSIPDGVVVDNEIRNIPVLMDKVQELIFKAMPGGADADFVTAVNWTSGILCDRIFVKHVPKVSERELVLQTAMGRSPFDDVGNVLDYSITDRREDGVEAMIVAAKKDGLSSCINLFQALSTKLFAIDVDAFVLCNAYFAAAAASSSKSFSEDEEEDSILLLNLGYSKSYAAFLRNGHFSTARSIIGGSIRDLQEQLAGPLGISVDQCGELLMETGNKKAGLDEEKVKTSIEFAFEEIAMKVDTALRYFSSADNYKRPSKIIISGGGSNIKGLISFLSNRLSLEVVQLNPFGAVQIDKARFPGFDWKEAASIYAVALGLALRRF